jgi:two-component system, chemotaxis family, chemotaxis protein CheY
MSNKILLVDDDPDLLDIFKESLEIREYMVITATNGLEAVEAYNKTIPCVVFMDIKMPKMDGYEAFSKIIEDHKDAKIVFTTGHEDVEKTKIAFQNGLLKILNKPILSKDVLEIIKENNC